MIKCADWILQKQVRTVGDWKVKNKKGQPGGWYFEFNNEFYPDVDDSAMFVWRWVRSRFQRTYQRESVQRAIDWIFSMQCKIGGWASFDKDNTRMVFQHIPFADTTPCSIRRRWTSADEFWKCWRPMDMIRPMRE